MITGIYFSALSFAAVTANILFKRYSLRAVGVFGAVIFFIGSLLTVFATSVAHLIITFGILEGKILIALTFYFQTSAECIKSIEIQQVQELDL